MTSRALLFSLLAASTALTACGCQTWPEMVHEPRVRNPYPELQKVAVAPFFNLSTEPTLDGRACALAYFNELQQIPGFEVVPIGVTEQTLRTYKLALNQGEHVRQLAQILEVDAVVIGAVTDYDPFYPPRYSLTTEWYAADPSLAEIIAGYGLPLGSKHELLIPARLRYEAEFAQARQQVEASRESAGGDIQESSPAVQPQQLPVPSPGPSGAPSGTLTGIANVPAGPTTQDPLSLSSTPRVTIAPDATAPQATSTTPVLRHTSSFNGNDPAVIAALKRDSRVHQDERMDGWQGYVQRSGDFIRFCSRMHIQDMLSARGGADETRVTWRWSKRR
ncbi:MAG: hypothetical protein MPJ50_07245 [Pirellulales bacterium]|nr:hypothetical protein [Pirellulales bacterium]